MTTCRHSATLKDSRGKLLFFIYSRSWFYNDWSNSLCLLTRIFTFARQLQLLPTKVLKLKNSQLKIGGEAESCKNLMLCIVLFPKKEWSCLLRYLIRGSGPSLAFFCWQLVWGSLLFCHFYFTMHCKQTEVSVLKTSLFKFKDRITLLSTCLASISYIIQIRNALSDKYIGKTFTNYKKFHSNRSLPGCFHKKSTLILHKTLLQKQALGYRERRGQGGRREKVPSESDNLHSFFSFFFYLDGLCFTAPRTNHALRLSSFFSLFLSSVRVCVGVEAWWALGWGQRGYLWFISGHSSKKPVDAASLSHPLCPSHCFSIGLPLCRWHTGKRCPALPMLPSWSWSYSGHTHWLPAKRMNSDRPHSAQLAPPSYLALQLPVFYPFLDLSLHLAPKQLHLHFCFFHR